MSDDRKTADGLTMHVGDKVWRIHCGAVRLTTVQKHMLGVWGDWFCASVYSTERAALDAAIEQELAALKKAKSEQRRASKAIERLNERRSRLAS